MKESHADAWLFSYQGAGSTSSISSAINANE
jgi:hypothetical protein